MNGQNYGLMSQIVLDWLTLHFLANKLCPKHFAQLDVYEQMTTPAFVMHAGEVACWIRFSLTVSNRCGWKSWHLKWLVVLSLLSPNILYFAAVCLDPGLTNCTTHIVTVTINGDDASNTRPKQKPGEFRTPTILNFYPSHWMGPSSLNMLRNCWKAQ